MIGVDDSHSMALPSVIAQDVSASRHRGVRCIRRPKPPGQSVAETSGKTVQAPASEGVYSSSIGRDGEIEAEACSYLVLLAVARQSMDRK